MSGSSFSCGRREEEPGYQCLIRRENESGEAQFTKRNEVDTYQGDHLIKQVGSLARGPTRGRDVCNVRHVHMQVI
jgi:hypothetical protein